ncbi:uncharacterized protein L969DRAFT_102873 [Mixia osmundae IAM 14324]|uniref:Phospholipid/glycerol acyltransferase domain-containing protein n=1 Tax=Mixia osmundae (strain CBS 9802 / IAM 14324 / JCM 22182 / KY 12970) TaxID=764103 RepID=G7E8Q3_MIXOS|nr:uncharacterized protein L969DRAFT_102873 [Mixia osmundae IAM 14324]KEI40157.1 hypothetical protein L969DRAFT_102873 [Mixia osmundae IAM 14324]GAA99521.1 hypothetical protein E5Q_06222 [Mixia osmundae IAM 14324]
MSAAEMKAGDLLARDAGSTKGCRLYRPLSRLAGIACYFYYSEIEISGLEHLPGDGIPTVVAAAHPAQHVDAFLIVGRIPIRARSFFRPIARDKEFRNKSLLGWFLESGGCLPIMRQSDYEGQQIGAANAKLNSRLIEELGNGQAILLSPEGRTLYQPHMASLKTGIARTVSDTLTAHRDEPDWKVVIANVSLCYLHRERFRSKVLLRFNEPIILTPRTHPELICNAETGKLDDFAGVRALTELMGTRIKEGMLDLDTWDTTRQAIIARSILQPLDAPRPSLSDYVTQAQNIGLAIMDADFYHDSENSEKSSQTGKSTPSSPIVPTLGKDSSRMIISFSEKSIESSEEGRKSMLPDQLLNYLNRLEAFGINDHDLMHVATQHSIWLLLQLLVRIIVTPVIGAFAIPATILLAPMFLMCSYSCGKMAKGRPNSEGEDCVRLMQSRVRILAGFVGLIVSWFLCLIVLVVVAVTVDKAHWVWPILLVVPVLQFLSIKVIEFFYASTRTGLVFCYILTSRLRGSSAIPEMQAARTQLHTQLQALVKASPYAAKCTTTSQPRGKVWLLRDAIYRVAIGRQPDWSDCLSLHDQTRYK